ncbi:MAG TPA: hypothetical protein VEA69_05815 [Tepidisphaeraceae bacterium]|nr:hypothetical protein [Tepidisphaeraceae bacterium]
MRRPLPNVPRGPRIRKPCTETVLFACPRLSPEWELGALVALMKPKPHTKAAVANRAGDQPWPAGADAELDEVVSVARDRMGLALDVHRAAGDYHFACTVARERLPDMLAVVRDLSQRLPETWLTLGRLYVHGGTFYRRKFGNRLELVVARNVSVPREVTARWRGNPM